MLLSKAELSQVFSIAAGHKYFLIQKEKRNMLRKKKRAGNSEQPITNNITLICLHQSTSCIPNYTTTFTIWIKFFTCNICANRKARECSQELADGNGSCHTEIVTPHLLPC